MGHDDNLLTCLDSLVEKYLDPQLGKSQELGNQEVHQLMVSNSYTAFICLKERIPNAPRPVVKAANMLMSASKE